MNATHERVNPTARRLPAAGLALLAAPLLLAPAALAQGSGIAVAPAATAAFTAGIVSFLSPCVLPLVPSFLSALGERRPVVGALGFVAGFSLVFVALGASASLLGGLLAEHRALLTRLGGLVVLFFGLVLLGVVRLPALRAERRANLAAASRLGPVALGAAFALGWTPCIGPVLGAILGLAATGADLGRGAGLLLAYSAGLAVPFVLSALAWDRLAAPLRRARRWQVWLERAGGALLVVTGILLLTDRLAALTAALAGLTPPWLLRLL